MKSTFARPASLVLVLLLIPACSGGKKVSPTLFSESFNGGFPSTNWTAPVVTGSATAAADLANGFPAPSLKMSSSGATASVKTDSIPSFNTPSVTVSAAMATLSGGNTQLGSGSVSILDGTPAVVASATWDNATGLITFHINGGAPDFTVPAASVGDFHRLVFNVTGSGTATWSFDGGSALVTQAGFPGGMLKIELGATFGAGTAWPSFFFDEISVTTP
jgi:hypothetical protein